MQTLIFRADGNNKIGLGHIYRSLAVAKLLSNDFNCIFLSNCEDLSLFQIYIQSGINVILDKNLGKNSNEEIAYIKSLGKIIVLDGYHFSSDFQLKLRDNNKIICIDDIHAYHFYADIIINHSLSAKRKQYSLEGYTQTFLGLQYSMLRNCFNEYSKNRTVEKVLESKDANNVFICLGGADPDNKTLFILQQLLTRTLPTGVYHLVIGPAYKYKCELINYISSSALTIRLYEDLSDNDMLSLMCKCKYAICSASSVAIEYLAVGGCLNLIVTANNQKEFYERIIEEKAAIDFNLFKVVTKNVLLRMVQNQIRLIDGLQENRLMKIFKSL